MIGQIGNLGIPVARESKGRLPVRERCRHRDHAVNVEFQVVETYRIQVEGDIGMAIGNQEIAPPLGHDLDAGNHVFGDHLGIEVAEGPLQGLQPAGKAGNLKGRSIELIGAACRDLIDQGEEVIVPGMTEIPVILDSLTENLPVPVIDSNQVFATYAAEFGILKRPGPFKIGIVGGVGPAATVDFMDKVIKRTDAGRDQEHIKMVVEHNPQIPDRTENLISDGTDPTVSLYAACKKLESQSANLIAIPCNTAHAFVERIQSHLGIPIVNMIFETVQFVKAHCSGRGDIGLLATTGTVKSRVYHDIIDAAGFKIITPDDVHQAKVMEAIYGDNGVKAGFTEGPCKEDLMAALVHRVDRGAGVIILGCTELPLLLSHNEAFPVGDRIIAVLDPTDVLARKVVQFAQGASEP